MDHIKIKSRIPHVKRKLLLPNDSPDVMVQIMRIVHSKFNVVAQSLSFRQLVDLAVTSERYKMNQILIPFLPRWSMPYRQSILEPGKEEWLFVAYQFGYEEDYRLLAKHMAWNCRVDKLGYLVNSAGNVITGIFPEKALRMFVLHPFCPLQILYCAAGCLALCG
jgi:hypothetical protein